MTDSDIERVYALIQAAMRVPEAAEQCLTLALEVIDSRRDPDFKEET